MNDLYFQTKSKSGQRGVALVTTLVMLSVVTLMAVVFLSVTRRERVRTQLTEEQSSAQLLADAAIARVQAQVASHMMASNNPLAINFMVSTNYRGGAGFYNPSAPAGPTNVAYVYENGAPLSGNDQMQVIGNLQYDARPPVFVRTNQQGAMDFRFWLDFNRNSRFETNGLVTVIDNNGAPIKIDGTNLVEHMTGDPEWIGVLEYPHLPHSETNRFVGRYAFMVLPSGRTLDLNHVHNHAKRSANDQLVQNSFGYTRGQGVGTWELNLAAFLRDLNNNTWGWPRATYQFNPVSALSSGRAFDDARSVLAYRYATNRMTLWPASDIFPPPTGGGGQLRIDLVDWYADSTPLVDDRGYASWPENDDLNRPWPGSYSTNLFTDVQELFTQVSTNLSGNLRMPNRRSTYDSYTFYRALSQIGVDSAPSLTWYNPYLPSPDGPRKKVHLNYTNLSETISTNLVEHGGDPSGFPLSPQTNLFMLLADAFLKANVSNSVMVVTNSNGRTNAITNYFIGETRVRPDIAITNIQLFHTQTNLLADSSELGFQTNYFNTNREYTATIHRLLQVAANISDSRTNIGGSGFPFDPSLFRPVFRKTSTNVVITGFRRELSAGFTATNGWVDLEAWGRNPIQGTNFTVNIYGVPAILGAKKGLPNFNEFVVQTVMSVTRKLEMHKPNPNGPITLTNQSHQIAISNLFGLEAWNSYSNAFQRPLYVRATNLYSMALYNFPGTNQMVQSNLVMFTNGLFAANFDISGTNGWPGATNFPNPNPSSFILPIFTNRVFVTNSWYVGHRPPYLFPATNKNQFIQDGTFEPPRLHLHITNKLVYLLLDGQNGHVLDYVNFDKLTNFVDIGRLLVSKPLDAAGEMHDGAIKEDDFWDTNRVPGRPFLTQGVQNQIQVSMGQPEVPQVFWRNFNALLDDKARSIDLFRVFMGTNELYDTSTFLNPPPIASARHQAPFTPTRKLIYTSSWQVNDPLVHYTVEDLYDHVYTAFNITNFAPVMPPNRVGAEREFHNLGKLNKRYRPWGGNPDTDFAADRTAALSAIKDPLIFRSDDWNFPIDDPTTSTNGSFVYPNIGWIGRIHRGSPWQTVYLKSAAVDPKIWTNRWGATPGTHPSLDFRLLDTITTAPHETAARGLLGVNQTNVAAWSAVLSGMTVWSNSIPSGNLSPLEPRKRPLGFTPMVIEPTSPQLYSIVESINRAREGWVTTLGTNQVAGTFFNVGSILAAPALSDNSPFLNLQRQQTNSAISDPIYEAIPQQIFSMVQQEQPRLTVYAFGQTLRPAPRSLVTDASYYNLCTNYQVSGEFAVKAVLRYEGELNNPANPLRTVIESYDVLPPE